MRNRFCENETNEKSLLNAVCALHSLTITISCLLLGLFVLVVNIHHKKYKEKKFTHCGGAVFQDLTLNVSTLLANFASASLSVSVEIRWFNLSRSPSIL